MDSHSNHMELEKQGAEREAERKAILAQRAADLEHLLKNTPPSLREMVSLGDSSNGSGHSISDYAAQILTAQIDLLKEANEDLRLQMAQKILTAQIDLLKEANEDLRLQMAQIKTDFETLRSQVLADWTPETPLEEPQAPTAPTPAPVIEMPAPTEAPKEVPATPETVTP